MSAYLGLSSCETLRFYKTTRSQIPIKLGPYRPGQVLRVANGGGSQNSRQSAYEGSNAVSPTHRPTVPPRDIPVTHFCQKLSRPQGHNEAGRIMSKKNYNYPVGNRSSYVPACSAVPIPTALSLSDFNLTILRNKLASKIRNYNLKTTHSRSACRHDRHRLHNFKRYLKFSTVIPLNTAPLLQMTLSLKGLILRSP